MSAFVKILVAGGLATASLFASAESIAPRHHDTAREINERQARQEQRIERGVARGMLTRHEARELRQEQREIRRAEARALADGRIDWREARRLTAMLDAADTRIRDLRHDRDHVARRG